MCWIAGLWRLHPPVGFFIAILAVLGVLVPLYREWKTITKREQALWTLCMFVLLLLEIKSICQDRNEHEASEAKARTEQLKLFGEIAGKMDRAITDSETQFKETMVGVTKVFEKTEQAANTATDAVNTITGGSGFCFVEIATDKNPAVQEVLLHIQVVGHHPLRNVKMRVLDYRKFIADSGAIRQRGNMNVADIVNLDATVTEIGDIPPGGTSLFIPVGISTDTKSDKNYNIEFYAMNGNWRELLRFRKINSEWSEAIRVTRFDGKGDKFPPVFERINRTFPRTNEGKVDWSN